jgi:SAM-dependent methyltransferase
MVTRVTASDGATSPSFAGLCTVCGWRGPFVFTGEPRGRPARDFRCGACGCPIVYQAEASAILDTCGRGKVCSLDALVEDVDFRRSSVFYIGHAGPIRRRLKRLENYSESCFVEGRPLGEPMDGHPRRTNQDHQRLTFDDERFDLITSSHVLEHVPDPRTALAEALRTLKPAGCYIFSVPGPLHRRDSVVRAEVRDGGIVHHEPAQFHRSPEGEPALVFTDFGFDLLDTLEQVGFIAFIARPHRSIQIAHQNSVFVGIKPTANKPWPMRVFSRRRRDRR